MRNEKRRSSPVLESMESRELLSAGMPDPPMRAPDAPRRDMGAIVHELAGTGRWVHDSVLIRNVTLMPLTVTCQLTAGSSVIDNTQTLAARGGLAAFNFAFYTDARSDRIVVTQIQFDDTTNTRVHVLPHPFGGRLYRQARFAISQASGDQFIFVPGYNAVVARNSG
jgi:hypothetical protein